MLLDLQQAAVFLTLISVGGGIVWTYFGYINRQGDRGEAAAQKASGQWKEEHVALEKRVTAAERIIQRIPTPERFAGVERTVGALDKDIAALSEKVDGVKREMAARDDVTMTELKSLGKQMDGVDTRLQTVINHLMAKEAAQS
tara:strand:- start:3710 stop:4138 length:429 start_codon:yes stop_codon:yes gene_type:complete